ncbi:MAG: DUF3427 domain-containing protein [Methylophilaceae bacterium]|nr:DUF3427 domain-containing protein [Methylophilaceae bacterium]
MAELILYQEYSRDEVHDIFSPDTKFTPQTGTWGLHGIVKIPDRDGDFVFFVTYGQSQSNHDFDESVTEDGVLSWQSQPSQDFANKVIKQFINHDETTNNIYLFLRTKSGRNYSYLGKLKYITHDAERQKPVYFQWQILDWNIKNEKLSEIGLDVTPSLGDFSIQRDEKKRNQLSETNAPVKKDLKTGVPSKQFKFKKTDFAAKDAKNRSLGLAGEELVVEYEKKLLASAGLNDLATLVRHVSKELGDGAGYDVLSYDLYGNKKYIEVKTTKGNLNTEFYISINEVNFSEQYSKNYYLYRLYNFDEVLNYADFFILPGQVSNNIDLKPINFKAIY